MRQWRVRIPSLDPDAEATIHAETRSKARYRYWLRIRDVWPDLTLMAIHIYAMPKKLSQ